MVLAVAALLVLAGRVAGERAWWGTLSLYPPQVAYLAPLGLTLPLAVVARNRWAWAANALWAALVLGPIMGCCLPLRAAIVVGAPRVRVLSYNIRGAEDGFALIRAHLWRYKPDVVVLTEVRGWPRELDLREELARQFQGWHRAQAGDVLILSRWPIQRRGEEFLGPQSELEPSLNRRMAWAEVQAPFGRFRVAGVHFHTALRGRTLSKERKQLPGYLRHTAEVRMQQAEAVNRWLRTGQTPALVAGDFNTPPVGRVYSRLRTRLADSYDEAGLGWGYTYPSRLPLIRIDYVFHSPEWETVRADVGPAPGSDHRPLFAELAYVK